ncbi:hypothetical protein BJX68DRAFT_225892 [Aspergillus pseudodeflectus]|uniref:Uncharacterized protein n=1 Tax=Aspergillus pseudodeflectus TaxID=176178 RepID=A0ABR4L4P3_9EURO
MPAATDHPVGSTPTPRRRRIVVAMTGATGAMLGIKSPHSPAPPKRRDTPGPQQMG